MWEKDINLHEIAEIRTKTTLYFGVGAIQKMDLIAGELKKKGLDRVLAVTGRSSYKSSGAWEVVEQAFRNHGIEYALYDKVTPNPEHKSVDEASELGRAFGAKAVIGIGGGSSIDACKSVAIMLEYPNQTCAELYEHKFTPERAVPIVAINLTHGTGTEVNRYAVVSIPEKKKKKGIGYEFMYPIYAIDDPALMQGLSEFQTIAVSLDALNHVFEASTSREVNAFAMLCCKEAVRLIHKYLPRIIADAQDLEARYYLAYAAMIAGLSFDSGDLHITHALEHPLSAINTEFTHGLGLAILLPAVLEVIFDARKETILDLFRPILGEDENLGAKEAAQKMKDWLASVGVKSSLKEEGFKEEDIDTLTDLVSVKGLSFSSPVEVSRELVRSIYEKSF
ncbi:MAG: iron-containing alcohol dehydrogenase [Bacillota bacterium]|nr:iron-containing alcohol dehydrogenase [Bacillota bacterium]